MVTLTFEKEINAPIKKVWDVLWNKDSYETCTSAFMPGSTMKSDWEIGGKTYFLGPGNNGMVSTIERMNAPKEIVFRHLGEVHEGVEDISSEKVKPFQGSLEKYFLSGEDDKTKLVVMVDIPEAYKSHMEQGFSRGLELVKELAEK